MMKCLLAVFLFFYSLLANAAWLAVCDQSEPLPSPFLLKKTYTFPQKNKQFLLLSEQPLPQCEHIELKNIDTDNLLWAELISPEIAKQINHTIILQGLNKADTQPVISEIIPILEAKPVPYRATYLPLNVELIDKLRITAFGKEERVSYERENDIKINCEAGRLPAGAILSVEHQRLPEYSTLIQQITYKSNANFSFGVSDQQRYQRGEPSLLGNLVTRFTPQIKNYSLSGVNLKINDPLYWTFVCPQQPAQLNIKSLRLKTHAQQNIAGRSFWAWRPRLWQETPDQLLNTMYKLGVETVFISLVISPDDFHIKNQDKLRQFLQKAQVNNISVWVVEGDPHVILSAERQKFVKRASAINAFNLSLDKTMQLAGIQYDIEPYLIAGFSLAAEKWYEMYVATIKALDQALLMPIEIVVPFWWYNVQLNDIFLIDAVRPYIAGLTIMNYRTDKAMIENFAHPFLLWGSEHEVPIRIALEAGPLPDETQWRYHKKTTGELWRLTVAGFDVLVLWDKPQQNLMGDAFLFTTQRQVSSSQVTFHHDKKALFDMLPELEAAWRIWPTFNGIALHGVDTL